MSFARKRKGPIKCLNQFKQTMDRRAIFILCTGAYICIHKHASSCICRLYRNEGVYIQILIFQFFFCLFGMATFQQLYWYTLRPYHSSKRLAQAHCVHCICCLSTSCGIHYVLPFSQFLDGRVIFVEVAKPRSELRQGSKQTPKQY